MKKDVKITRLKITNYRGVAALEVTPGDGATVAMGRNGRGKSSVLHALQAALAARDIGPDAIRHGADSAEILVDMDDLSVRRAITKKGTTLTVSKDGFNAQRPQATLTDLLGASPVDPLDLLLLKAKERRARILAALPCSVTREQLLTWAPTLPDGVDVSGHGLEVVEKVRSLYYDRRTAANAKAKETDGEARRARDALGEAKLPENVLTTAQAQAQLTVYQGEALKLSLRADDAAAQEQRNARTRATIAEKRTKAASLREGAGEERNMTDLHAAIGHMTSTVDALRKQLVEAEAELTKLGEERQRALAANQARARDLDTAGALEIHATELEASLAEQAQPPTPEESAAVGGAIQRANIALAQAKGAEHLAKQIAEVERLEGLATADAAVAKELDVIVKRLTDEAPRAIANADAIPGLTLDGDEVLLDGVRLDALCGAEQMRLCVQIAKRASGSAKFLVVDQLERIDEDTFDAFVAEVTSDGTQLIGSRVSRGELQIVHVAAAKAVE